MVCNYILGGLGMIQLTYHGHSTVEIACEGHRLIIDPFLTGNPVATAKADDIKADYVLLTHGHNDHIMDAVKIAKNNGATIIATYELAMYMESQGCKVHPLGVGGAFRFPFGKVKFTFAFHSAGELLPKETTLQFLGFLPAFC
jgi:L-ascorbate metabolism protein UlaG (beta-lactamase superfamily)